MDTPLNQRTLYFALDNIKRLLLTGSGFLCYTDFLCYCPRSSARIEQWIPNPWAACSNHVGGTSKNKHLAFLPSAYFLRSVIHVPLKRKTIFFERFFCCLTIDKIVWISGGIGYINGWSFIQKSFPNESPVPVSWPSIVPCSRLNFA